MWCRVLWVGFFINVFGLLHGQVAGPKFGRLEKLGASINSDKWDESAPVISVDGQRLYLTRTGHPNYNRTWIEYEQNLSETLSPAAFNQKLISVYQSLGAEYTSDPARSSMNQDVWFFDLQNNPDSLLAHPDYPLNNAFPNSIVSRGLTANSFLSINQFYDDGSMYAGFSTIYVQPDDAFSFPKPLHIYNFNMERGDVNLSMSYDGDVLVISMRQFDTMGENDLYVCFRMRENVYSTPKHMGRILNTSFQETSPFITRDKRRIYFSSNRPGSLGGNDLYYSDREDYTWVKWSEPVRLEEPFNSTSDDSEPFIDDANSFFYFSSRRDQSSDIFRISMKPVPYLEEPLQIFGEIRNAETGKLMQAEVLYGPMAAKGYLEYFRTRTGQFEMTIEREETWKFLPFKQRFTAKRMLFDVTAALSTGKIHHKVVLYLNPTTNELDSVQQVVINPPVEEVPKDDIANNIVPEEEDLLVIDDQVIRAEDLKVGRRLSFYKMQFVKSQSTLLKKSSSALKQLLTIMTAVPTLEVRIEGHTDNVGDAEKNVLLSEQRADAVKQYLMKQGVSGDRIKTKGYGPYRPIASNSLESKRQKNRRVEIRILKK